MNDIIPRSDLEGLMEETATPVQAAKPLRLRHPADLPAVDQEKRWLVEGVCGHNSAMVIAGLPKSGKTWAVSDLGVSVGSGAPFMNRFPVSQPGRVLVFPAEDSLTDIRSRIDGIARARGVDIANLNMAVVEESQLLLDRPEAQARLEATVAQERPAMVIIDPLVRVFAGDENSSSDISRFLRFLRKLTREYSFSVVIVHHFRKASAGNLGQSLRGSGDIWGWYDDALFLTRERGDIVMLDDHRSARTLGSIRLTLTEDPVHLQIAEHVQDDGDTAEDDADEPTVLDGRIVNLLHDEGPIGSRRLRQRLGVKGNKISAAIRRLKLYGWIAYDPRKRTGGWYLVD